jgi:hypothetical protein
MLVASCVQVGKHWAAGGAAAGAGGVALADQLADKGSRHTLLLEALAAAGLLQELPADVVAGLLEDGERLAAVAALLQVGGGGGWCAVAWWPVCCAGATALQR